MSFRRWQHRIWILWEHHVALISQIILWWTFTHNYEFMYVIGGTVNACKQTLVTLRTSGSRFINHQQCWSGTFSIASILKILDSHREICNCKIFASLCSVLPFFVTFCLIYSVILYSNYYYPLSHVALLCFLFSFLFCHLGQSHAFGVFLFISFLLPIFF